MRRAPWRRAASAASPCGAWAPRIRTCGTCSNPMRGPPPITIPNGYPCSPRKNRRSSTPMAMSCVSSRRRMTAAARCGATPMAAMPSGTDSCRHTIRSNRAAARMPRGTHAKGQAGKVLCLTFDDGHDPRYTPAILDILRSHGVRATFFIIGANADQNIDLVKREYAEGHDIGNHTYTHPNIALVSEERAALELSTTQRIIENALGVSTVLFRPPYNADSQPQTPEEILPLLRAQKAGYVTVGERIDPRDWVKGVSADEIVSEIRDELLSADDPGHVILLHDAGGDRAATVAALPRILEGLQSQGYRFVPLSELLGQTRAQLMPAPSGVEMRWAHIEGGAFDSQGALKKVIGMLFLWAIYLTLARSLFYGVLAVAQKWRVRHARFGAAFRPPVSVIIAAYNEEKVIVRTVESILRNGYDDLELVIVDDGSQDATLEILRRDFGDRPNVRILSQPNGGKSSALNNAIAHAQHDILIALDADTIFRAG